MVHAARIFFVVAVLAAGGFGHPAAAQGVHGALAISTSTGAYGYGFNYDTPQGARGRALAECGKHARDCRIFVDLQRACIAIARGSNNAFGWAIGYPNDERPERALNECASQDGTACAVVNQFCSGTQ